MLSNTGSMQQGELSLLQEFSSNLQIVENVLNSRLSDLYKIQNIAINKSSLLNAPLFCFFDQNNSNQMSIQNFLKLCVDRWHQEIQYQQDILNLKDQIINELEKLCNQMNDENLIESVRKQREQIIETLITKTNFDKKQLAGDFCKGFLNGFEIEIIEKINLYVIYVVWMPFVTPLPGGAIEFIKKIVHEEIGEAPSEENIMGASTKIMRYIGNQLREKEIYIQRGVSGISNLLMEKNFITINQLEKILKLAQENKKACVLIINKIEEGGNAILNERSNIQTICVKMEATEFLETNIPFTYEYLELKGLKNQENFEQANQILQKLPKLLKSAKLEFEFDFENNKQNIMKIIKNELEHAYELSFKYFPGSLGTDEKIITLSNIFRYSKTIQHLHLNFRDASITISAIDYLATSMSKMNQIQFLDLSFSNANNAANNYSMTLFAQAIGEMTNLYHLGLDFGQDLFFFFLKRMHEIRSGNNQITDNGVVQLSRAIAKIANIQQLCLDFRNNFESGKNEITDNGIEELSRSIANFKCIQKLALDFGEGRNRVSDKGIEELSKSIMNFVHLNYMFLKFCKGDHQIGDKGIHALALALKKTNNISYLYFDFSFGNNLITDTSMDPLAEAVNQMQSSLSLYLYFGSNNNPRVTTKGESIIKNARTNTNIVFIYNEQKLKGKFEDQLSVFEKNKPKQNYFKNIKKR